jgi:hypothetical protein
MNDKTLLCSFFVAFFSLLFCVCDCLYVCVCAQTDAYRMASDVFNLQGMQEQLRSMLPNVNISFGSPPQQQMHPRSQPQHPPSGVSHPGRFWRQLLLFVCFSL